VPERGAESAARVATPFSLTTRLLLATGIALIAFLGLTGLALDRAFNDSASQALRDRIQSELFALLGAVEISAEGKLSVPADLPGPRFSQPGSGRYAAVIGRDQQWYSASMLGFNLPLPSDLKPGERRFTGPIRSEAGRLIVFSQAVAWERPDGALLPLVFHVAEDLSAIREEIAHFRGSLWSWLVGSAAVLLVFQLAVLWWSLQPLRKIAADLLEIEQGKRDRLDAAYPQELRRLAFNLNALLANERQRLARYRKSLGDLAHSLKTPLAVMRSQLGRSRGAVNTAGLDGELQRMDDIVAYQLQRAATGEFQALGKPRLVIHAAEEIVLSLEKVYADKQVSCQFDIDPEAAFHGGRGDLLELLGNVLENAFKYCRNTVEVRAGWAPGRATEMTLSISVADDGPGISPEQRESVLKRGVRADEQAPGHGIGLAIVVDIVASYGGVIRIDESPLGGALVRMEFPRHAMRSKRGRGRKT